RTLFQTLAASSLAAGGAGCDKVDAPFDRAQFDANACVDGTYRWVHGLTPAEPVDYAALRRMTIDWETNEGLNPVLAHETGAPCTEASDTQACLDALEALPTDAGFRGPSGFDIPPEMLQVAYTRADEDEAVTNLDNLRAFVGTVDTAEEAMLLTVLEHGHLEAGFQVDCRT